MVLSDLGACCQLNVSLDVHRFLLCTEANVPKKALRLHVEKSFVFKFIPPHYKILTEEDCSKILFCFVPA
jgi:hypothetical protein